MTRTPWKVALYVSIFGSLLSAARADASPTCTPVEIQSLGGTLTSANGINDWGQVVGRGTDANQTSHAFLWQDGKTQALAELAPGGSSEANAINELGQIVGAASDSQSRYIPVVWVHGQVRALPLIGNDSGESGVAVGINNRGQIIGTVNRATCLLWQSSRVAPTALPGLAGGFCLPSAINEQGTVVGTANGHGFVWHDGVMTDIHDGPGTGDLVYTELWDISDLGVAFGIGRDANSHQSIIVWTQQAGVQRLDEPVGTNVALNRWGLFTFTPNTSGVGVAIARAGGRSLDVGEIVAPAGIGGVHANNALQLAFGNAVGDTRAFFCALR
jgi:probable HAF family extracellular repeat protein